MDIADVVTEEFVEFDRGTPVSKLRGAFEDPTLKAVVVSDGEEYVGVVTRRQLTSSHEKPGEKVGNVVWHVPTVNRTEDVREVARLMVGSNSKTLPVVRDGEAEAVVTAEDLLEAVRPYLGVLTVADVATDDLVTIRPDSTVGGALHELREGRMTHLPVVDEEGDLLGILSLHDVIDFTTRTAQRQQGGDAGSAGEPGGQSAGRNLGARGGFGSRAGEMQRLLDLPVRDVMSSPVATVSREQSLDEAVGEMFDHDASSLVVLDDDGDPDGIVTKTDVLESLTWTAEGRRPVQVYGVDLLDDMTYDDVADLVDGLAGKYADMSVLEAKIHLHEHDEKLRGVPLVLARIRLFTDRGHFIGEDEGYGARHALHLAANAVERQVLEGKEYGRTKKHPDEAYWEKFFGWWLTGEERR